MPSAPSSLFQTPPDRTPEVLRDQNVLVVADNLTKIYAMGDQQVVALDHATLDIYEGEFVALMGPSGSGKSTLLHILAGIDRPTSGSCVVLGQDIAALNETELAQWRNQCVGFVFQTFNLIPVRTARENVEMPLLLTGLSRRERRRQVETALSLVGLVDRMDHTPRQLSGGQQQRVAIARAIATDPDLILADEPTGNLDAQSADDVLRMFRLLNTELGKTIVMVTHDPHAAGSARTVRYLEKGRLLPPGQKPKDW